MIGYRVEDHGSIPIRGAGILFRPRADQLWGPPRLFIFESVVMIVLVKIFVGYYLFNILKT
jgi:hypothetical protein